MQVRKKVMQMKYKIVNRKRFITFCVIIILTVSFLFSGIFCPAVAQDLSGEKYIEVTVESGDTLWQIAKEYGPADKDIRETIYDICKINKISAETLYEGIVIMVPVN